MIIDSHAHLGNDRLSNVEYYLDMMQTSGVSRTVLCPGGMVDITKLADYMRGKEPLLSHLPANDSVKEAFKKYPDKFYGFFMIDPEYHEISDVENAISEGFFGIKINPLINKISFKSTFIKDIFKLSAEKMIPIYTHLTMNPLASVEALREIIEDIRPVVIIGHMGFASADWEAVELARDNDNVFLETSVGAFMAIKKAINILGAGKILYGSEGPAHHQKVEIEKIRLLGLSSKEEEQIFSKNILGIIE
jgi:predicted TIM-barrel fold metal-dependent hydrolase